MIAAERAQCIAWHRLHDCRRPGACTAALTSMLNDQDAAAIDSDPTPPHGIERPNTAETCGT